MAKKARIDDTGDSDELQALFDSIASEPARRRLEVIAETVPTGDSEDLQALFDEVSVSYQASVRVGSGSSAGDDGEAAAGMLPQQGELFRRLGQLTRQFHDDIREMGYDRMIEETARAIPDARQRLSYVASMTEKAASRVLNATDVARPIQERLECDAQTLEARWARLYANQLSADDFRQLASDTHAFIKTVPAGARATKAQLMEIMMAQDFQDLTGQVIKRLVDATQRLEDEMLSLLVEFKPGDSARGMLNGPVTDATGRTDVVTDQRQVDDLLESLGF